MGQRLWQAWSSPWLSLAAGLTALLTASSATTRDGRVAEWIMGGILMFSFSIRADEKWGKSK